MTAPLTTTDRRSNIHPQIRQEPARAETKPTQARTTTTKSDTSTTNPKDSPQTAAPTLETSLASRRIHGADPSANQLRSRLEGKLEGDAPFGSKNLGAHRGRFPAIPGTPGAGNNPTIDKNGEASNIFKRGVDIVKDLLPKPEGFSENKDGSYTFNGQSGDDNYTVTQAKDGAVSVTNDETGKAYELTAEEAKKGVTINAGGGDDHVAVSTVPTEPGRDLGSLTIAGGRGDDHLDASGSKGPVELQGGGGDDHLTGGKGMDALAGGDGDDHLDGGAGNDQLLGQDGDDRVTGGSGDDFVMGGDGRDKLDAGTGGDAIYADQDDLSVDAGRDKANDVVVSEDGSVQAENIGANDVDAHYDKAATEQYLREHPELVIDGSEDFVDRTVADLGVMLGTEQGRGLLNDLTGALREQDEKLRFEEKEGEAGGTYGNGVVRTGMWAETYRDGSSRVPLPVTFHEMVHAYQDFVSGSPKGNTVFENGRAIENEELETAGLPWIDENGVRHTGEELPYTDNKFREELGLPTRSQYGREEGAPVRYEP